MGRARGYSNRRIFAPQTQAQTETPSVEQSFDLGVGLEYRYFWDEGQFEGQLDHYPSLSVTPAYELSWDDGYQGIEATGFFRWDRDPDRTHLDVRELYYRRARNNWEISIGAKKIFWGVTESNHLVDIINQTDQVESFDGEQKLGQPMVQYSLLTNGAGTFNFFLLPYHRRRNFPGEAGRFRFGVAVEDSDITYERDELAEWHPSAAVRWKHYFGIADVALSYFYGVGREPLFAFGPEGEIDAFYPIVNQPGLELQLTHGAFLWKLESIYRETRLQDFWALAAGLEYTFGIIDGNGLDIGVRGEYLYDGRDELALNALQNDVFVGSRIAFNDINDSSILFGGIFDLEQSSHLLSLEASRRWGSAFFLEVEARVLREIAEDDLIFRNFSADSFGRVNLVWRL